MSATLHCPTLIGEAIADTKLAEHERCNREDAERTPFEQYCAAVATLLKLRDGSRLNERERRAIERVLRMAQAGARP